MQANRQVLVWFLAGFMFLISCETPDKPNFRTSHKVEAPIMYDKTFEFMGGGDSDVLIDTTADNMDSLFTVVKEGDLKDFIIISKEQDFEFGDMNDGVPTINVDPTSFVSEVGELELTNFASADNGGNVGEATFEDFTSQPASNFSANDPVPNQPTPAPERLIDLETDLFESATIKSGSLDITLRNDLGYDLSGVEVTLVSDPDTTVTGDESDVVTENSGSINDGQEVIVSLPFDSNTCAANPSDCQLFNPNVRVAIQWDNGQTFNRQPQSLVVVSAEGNQLIASQVRAALEEQDFFTENVTSFDDTEFQFTNASHFIELKTGAIEIEEIQNELRIDIETMTITFPDFQECPSNLASTNPIVINHNPLQLRYSGNKKIPRASDTGVSGIAPAENVSIAGCKLFAENNEVNYTIDAITENTQEAPKEDQIRLVNENHSLSSSVSISNLKIYEGFGIVKRQDELLNDDEGEDGILDLNNPNEAELTEIDGLSDLSSQLDNIDFTNPTLSINYFSNIGLPTTIYGAFIGTNSDGEEVYLRGDSTGYTVQPGDPVDGLYSGGSQLSEDKMIKFTLDEINDRTGTDGSPIRFTKTNSNVDDFLNNLPSEIRFVGKAVINEDEGEATILDTLIFDPKISVDIPLAFATEEATTFKDTTEQDMSYVPSPNNGDDQRVESGVLTIDYVNGLPLDVELTLDFLDENYDLVTTISGDDSFHLRAGDVASGTRFVSNPYVGNTGISFTKEQLEQLYRTRYMKISARLITKNNQSVRIRTVDFITLSVRAELDIVSEVN